VNLDVGVRETLQQMLLSLLLSRQSECSELARMLGLWLIFMDPPGHTRLRKLLDRLLSLIWCSAAFISNNVLDVDFAVAHNMQNSAS
jgi:hypothetical protein